MTDLAPEVTDSAPRRWGPRAFSGLRRVPFGVALATLVVIFLVLCALFPELIAPKDPYQLSLLHSLRAPSLAFPFGTDQLGRDIFSRVVHGASYSLSIGLGATLIAVTVGLLVGLIAGSAGGAVDLAFMRIIDVLLAFPALFMSMAVVALIGKGSLNVLLAIAIAEIPRYARIVRSQVLVVRQSGYVEAALILGQRRWVTLLRHVLPNTIGPLIVLSTLGIGSAILSSAALSYLGLGPKPPTPEWGLMLAEGQGYLRKAWWIGVFPGIFATLTVVSTTVLGRYLKALSDGRA
ncbi:peptide/nickel transport system permease protein [Microvirga flocculans]|uniref:Peptide/nickel transport system permease protein n=1 Tax=Microvirga flocculans TaxID=217168 RepID=A0A7W6IBQ5_9HYPH|nr:ABC transporter permease [Microvirga flocculans]MBB4038454.1 peptide/nickel transport system permease protein [Microvirga flocculans]